MPYDQDLVRTLVEQLQPTARRVVATVALDRIRVVLGGDLEVDDLAEIRRVVDAAVEVGFGPVVEADYRGSAGDVLDRLSNLLGPEEDEDSLEGDEFWSFYVMATAETVLQGSLPEADSAESFSNSLHYSYTIADYLEIDSCGPAAQPLGDLEAERQVADLRYLLEPNRILDAGAIGQMKSDSDTLRSGYLARIREIGAR